MSVLLAQHLTLGVLLSLCSPGLCSSDCADANDVFCAVQAPIARKAPRFEKGTLVCFGDDCQSPLTADTWKKHWQKYLASGTESKLQGPLDHCCPACDSILTQGCSNSRQEEHIFVSHIWPFMRQSRDTPPVFVELGGYDGWHETNTHFLESCLGWKGLMIEGKPSTFKTLQRNRPNTVKISSAICNETTTVNFGGTGTGSHINAGSTLVPCAPLQSFFDVLDVQHISFFSLDVEGYELHVLKSVDWRKASIASLVVEELQWDAVNKAKNKVVRKWLEDAGYDLLGSSCWNNDVCDSFWINKKFVDVGAAKQHLLKNPFPGAYEIDKCQPTGL
ncbi:unnamed protein product [Symbiodinium pilosum]|uniref:Methyltransferase FkbM domain-containing protein n=1 Tax=Symbiodinium pilosum TaxID=2952 RepID=A0A812PEK7_SYMPI|nr:unnamed protein product [Symbiodinium pilosum]